MYKFALVLTLVFIGCSDDSKSTNNLSNNVRDLGVRDVPKMDKDLGATDTEIDAEKNDAGPDTESDMSGDCNPVLDTTFDIQQKAQIGELYSRASWSGSTGWVIYSAVPSEGDPQAIFLTRISCDAEVITPPRQISPVGSPDRHLQPVLVSKNGNTFVTWYSQGGGGGQTTLWFQSFNEDGTPITPEPVDITPKDNQDAPISNLFWETAIAASSDDAVVVGFSYATTNGFRVGVQPVNKLGVLDNFITPVSDTNDQTLPSFGVDADGNIVLSWIRDNAGESVSYLGMIPAGASQIVPASGVPSKPLTTPNALARLTKHATDSGQLFQAFQVTNDQRNDILVRSATDLSSVKSLTFGLTQRNFRPSIASGKNGGAVAWYRGTSASRGKVVLQAFNEELEGGPEVTFNMPLNGIPPYGPDIAHVKDDIYLVTWSEGESGREAEAKARFVKLSAP